MQVKAAVLRAADGPYQIEDVRLDDPGVGEILVRVVGAGMCHTDLLPRAPGFMASPPIITGHEASGIVEAVGPEASGFAPGDHVVLSYDSCRACANCRSGHPAYCDTFLPRNLVGTNLDGSSPATDSDGKAIGARWFGQSSFASHALASTRNAVKVGQDLPLELLGPLGCGIQTGAGSILIALGVRAGSSVAVFGVGGVGMASIMAAQVAGAAVIIAVDINPARLTLARELGATHTIDGAADDLLGSIQEIAGGGVQYTVDTTGVPAVIGTAIAALRPTGTCGLVGVPQGGLTLDPGVLSVGRNVMGILEGDAVPQVFIPQLIALWRQGRFPFDKLIKTFPLAAINEAEQASLAGDVVKPVLLPES